MHSYHELSRDITKKKRTFQREPNASSVSIDWTYRRQPLYWNKIPAPMRQLTIEHKRHCSSQHSEKEEVLCHLFLVEYLSCQHELHSKIPVSTNGKACEKRERRGNRLIFVPFFPSPFPILAKKASFYHLNDTSSHAQPDTLCCLPTLHKTNSPRKENF